MSDKSDSKIKKVTITLNEDIFNLLVEDSEENGLKYSTRATQLINLYLKGKLIEVSKIPNYSNLNQQNQNNNTGKNLVGENLKNLGVTEVILPDGLEF